MLKDPALLSALASTIEYTINNALRYDPASKNQLHTLAGESIAIVITDQKLVAQITIFEETLSLAIFRLEHFEENAASTVLKGELGEFIALLKKNSPSLAGTDVEVQGNVGTLESLQALIQNLDIDWQDALHEKLGPAAAPLSQVILDLSKYLKTRTRANIDTVKHFIEHEAELGVHQVEMSQFKKNVSVLRQSTDRLEAKIQHLLRHPKLNEAQSKHSPKAH